MTKDPAIQLNETIKIWKKYLKRWKKNQLFGSWQRNCKIDSDQISEDEESVSQTDTEKVKGGQTMVKENMISPFCKTVKRAQPF
jgi:hypothetical protein